MGDLVFDANPSLEIYRCIQGHTSSSSNRPPDSDYWHTPEPQDPPVISGGHGPCGNDWIDFFDEHQKSYKMYYRRDNSNTYVAIFGMDMEVDNPNFDTSKNRLPAASSWQSGLNYKLYKQVTHNDNLYQCRQNHWSTANNAPPNATYWWDNATRNLQHYCYEGNYGEPRWGAPAEGWPTVAEGNSLWDWSYDNYSPTPVRTSDATETQNCHAWALHGYQSGTDVSNWSDMNDTTGSKEDAVRKVRGQLYEQDTAETDDRCIVDEDHTWKIDSVAIPQGSQDPKIISIRWKDRASGVYTLQYNPSMSDSHSCAPKGLDADNLNTQPDGKKYYWAYEFYRNSDD